MRNSAAAIMVHEQLGDDEDTTFVCVECIGDEYLRNEVHEVGKSGICTYCESDENNVISLEDLADRIHEVLEAQFYMTSSEPEGLDYYLAKEGQWEQPGDPVAVVIADIAGLEEQIAEDIRDHLSGLHGGYAVVKHGGEDPYADDAQYEEQGADYLGFKDTWESFCERLRWRARFFSESAERDLDSIFGDLDTLKTYRGMPVVREITPTDDDRFVYRARVALSRAKLQHILKYPARELGAPPARLARAGRMNAAGISVFYGAEDADTCLAEIRAPVGSSVVFGRFEIIRPLRLLDMDALSQVYIRESRFDPQFGIRAARAAFLRHLVQNISRPVMPNDETFDYLPTQAIAEYLATKIDPSFDGIIFNSSQTGGEGRNVVLFNHASAAEPDDIPPGMTTKFWIDRDEDDPLITIFEEVPPPVPPKPTKSRTVFGIDMLIDEPLPPREEEEADWLDYREPTLRLDGKSVNVMQVTGVKYNYDTRYVHRSRFPKREEKDPPQEKQEIDLSDLDSLG
jgi:RES domain/HEPN/RES N-terminal domain 1